MSTYRFRLPVRENAGNLVFMKQRMNQKITLKLQPECMWQFQNQSSKAAKFFHEKTLPIKQTWEVWKRIWLQHVLWLAFKTIQRWEKKLKIELGFKIGTKMGRQNRSTILFYEAIAVLSIQRYRIVGSPVNTFILGITNENKNKWLCDRD